MTDAELIRALVKAKESYADNIPLAMLLEMAANRIAIPNK